MSGPYVPYVFLLALGAPGIPPFARVCLMAAQAIEIPRAVARS